MSKIVGIHCGSHDTSIAYIQDGEIKCIFEEEKMTGIKSVDNVFADPDLGLSLLKNKFSLSNKDIDHFCFVNGYKRNFYGKISHDVHYPSIDLYSHHKCHAIGSYFTSGFSGKVISISHDGKGYHSRGKVFLCQDGGFQQVHSQKISVTASLAGLWACVTAHLGWRMLKDEGKVVGLAAHGVVDEEMYSLMKSCFFYKNYNFYPAEWENLWHYCFNEINGHKLNDDSYRANYAATLQKFTEDIMYEYLRDIHNDFPDFRKLCLSGGLFANVKLNKFINELDFFDEIFVHPAMSDSGLALGAAICKANELGEIKNPFKLKNAFYGQSFSKAEWREEIYKHKNLKIDFFSFDKVAKLIDQGNIVGVFAGATEYGPRALGNRSILVRPTDKETHAKLNSRLQRTEIMPFAPSILEDHMEEVFSGVKSKYASEFMTLCFDTKQSWVDKIPAVIHEKDGSSRPQSINKSTNSHFYNIVDAYRKISGIPLVLNTSFNAHGEPINNYPHQVVKHLLDGKIDCIATEDFIISL
mgnify:CR=1 FL=1|jgi:carbamoyltransferase